MKKTYPLRIEGKHPDRVLEAVKHDIRKYFKRERNRPVPVGADIEAVDAAVQSGATAVYVEILSKHGVRVPAPAKPMAAASEGETSETDADHAA